MRVLALVSTAAVILAFYMAFLYAPTEAFMGDVQRILYIHAPSAQGAYLSLLIVFLVSVAYLRGRKAHWDALAVAAAEVGILFTTATLVTGTLWARKVWGWWWTWDPRLTTTLVLWILYVTYLLVRQAVDDPDRRAQLASILGILFFFNVPVTHLSVTWWRSIHPPNIGGPNGTELHPDMMAAQWAGMVAFAMLTWLLIWMRYQTEWLSRRVERLRVEGSGSQR